MARDRDEIPTGKVRRATSTTAALGPSGAKLAGSMITSMARSPERAREVLEQRHIEVADQALAVLGNLRGGAMKIGQLASFVDVEFLPPEYRSIYQERLAGLRDAAPAMGWDKVRGVIESELEQPIEEAFSSISHQALAAASIGQVHQATLLDGRKVAVKVQYPEIADALAADLDVASVLIRLGKALAPGLDPQVIAGELRERVLEELDFELEAQQQRTFARAYRGHPFIYVPEVITSLSRRRVMVCEWVDGIRFEDVLALAQEERNRVGEILVRFFFGSTQRLGRFNTDPHPGNYMLMPDGRVAFLDFGNTAAVTGQWMELTRHVLRAAMEGNLDDFTRVMDGLGYVRNLNRIDRELLFKQAVAVMDWYLYDRELQIDPDYVGGIVAALIDPRALEGSFRLARQVKVPPEEIWLRRMETSVLAVLGQLRARRNWHRILLELDFGAEPATALGRQEAEFVAGRANPRPRSASSEL
jgi:predicted unusual protein kinase regulating ubiquinone biosynthesis (AarF/ABC1/UbiB family)